MRCQLRTLLPLLPAIALLGLAACTPQPAGTADPCAPRRVADLPLQSMRNFLLAPVVLDGRPALFVVDTGAEASIVTPQAVARLHLHRDPDHAMILLGVAGRVRTQNVRVRELRVGGIVAHDASLGVGAIPSFAGTQPPISGLLGADILSRYDVELDVPHRRMALYDPLPCPAHAPLAGATEVPLARTQSGLVFVTALVDGKPVQARLDTGARFTLIKRETAAAMGLDDAALADDPQGIARGVGTGHTTLHRHLFETIGVPGALDRGMPADVAELQLPQTEMLLGLDYLAPYTAWISYSTGRLYLR
jgi:predicted aspartyl protease